MLNAFALKMIMAAFMVLDHLYFFLPEWGFPLWFTILGRLVAPTFCYLMTQSLVHTGNRGRYMGRMALAGGVMFAGNLAVAALARGLGYPAPALSNSIFLALAVSAALVDTLEQIAREGLTALRGVTGLACLFLCTAVEGTFLMPALAVIFYFLRDRKGLMCLAYLAGGTLMVALLWGGFTTASLRYGLEILPGLRVHVQFLQAFALVPILLYSGKPGPRGRFAKWFFYLFYPLHIWALYLLGQGVKQPVL